MPEMPDDAIAQLQAVALELRVQHRIQRHHFAFVDVVAHLPAKRTLRVQEANALGNHGRLLR